MSTRGFGFVSCDDAGPDVFVPAHRIGTAMHGDRVEVVARPSPRGREGEVLRVLERGLLRIAGRLARSRRSFVITTSDPRLPPEVLVEGELPLATSVGSEVVAQITSWPRAPGDPLRAKVLSVLGPRGSAHTEILKALIREGVNEQMPKDVVDEALGFPATVPEHDFEGREDLRDLDLVTIDPDDARDHDDAVWAEETESGYRVVVAIADVSHYVRVGSAIDREAAARGCTIYLPDRAIPMLPPELSTNLASLVPNEDRLTLAVEVQLGPQGAIRKYRFIEGVMRSRARITYGGAARALGLTETPAEQPDAESRLPLLKLLHTISRKLRARREKRGALGFELPEPRVKLDEKGEPIDIVRSKSDPGVKEAYEVVEDLMLLANEVVAADLSRRKLPAIYRVHEAPDTHKLEELAAVAQAFGFSFEAEKAAQDPNELARFLEMLEGTQHEGTLGYLALRAMQQATYQVANRGHYALAAKDYLHFTSPIRRYPDLAVHRIVRALIRNDRIDAEAQRLAMLGQAQQASRMERRAMTVEREAVNVYRCIVVKDKVGEELDAAINGVTDQGIFVAFDSPFVEARIPIDKLGSGADLPELDKLGVRLVSRRSGRAWALGDRIRVKLESVSVERREIVCVPADGTAPTRARRASVRPTREKPRDGGMRRERQTKHRGG